MALVYGTNEGLVDEYVKGFIKTVCSDINDPFQVVYMNASDVNADNALLFSEYASQSLLGGRRVIVVRDADNNLTKTMIKLFEEVKSDTFIVVYSASLNKRSSLVKLADDDADIISVACYEDRSEDIYSTVKNVMVKNNITINSEAMQLLCSRLSNDRKSNLGEIEKLIIYVGDKKNIVPEDIVNIIGDTSSSSMEDLCFFTASGDSANSQKSFNRLVKENTEPLSIVRSLYYHFERILSCVANMEKGMTLDKAVFALVPRVMFYRESSFKSQVSVWKKDRILGVLKLLAKCEKQCKTTNMPNYEIVSYTLMQVSSAAAKLRR